MWSRKRVMCFVLAVMLLSFVTLTVPANATDSWKLSDQDASVDSSPLRSMTRSNNSEKNLIVSVADACIVRR